jgi:glycosyltransferase involved in cell wall biosynthesis
MSLRDASHRVMSLLRVKSSTDRSATVNVMPRLCLNMIVKNESSNIARCLEAAAPHIDCYVICDTGSTDDTVGVVRELLSRHEIPGIVISTVFSNFEQARNEALTAARDSELEFDYILLCDADMELSVSDSDFRKMLDAPVYMISQRSVNGLEYPNVRLVRRDLRACYHHRFS